MPNLVSGQNTSRTRCAITIMTLCMVVQYCHQCECLGANVHRIRTDVEINGVVKFNSSGREVQTRTIVARGGVAYDQQLRRLGEAARYYLRAEGEATVGKSVMRHDLRPTHRGVGVVNNQSRLVFRSPAGALTQDELDLLEMQFDPLLLHDLLPTGGLGRGATRKTSDELIALLFFVDVVHASDIVSEILESDESTATLRISGKASCAVKGVSTEFEVSGQLRLSLDHAKIERVTLTIKENRSIGHASPGFEVTATIQTTISPIAASPHLTTKLVGSLTDQFDDENNLVAYVSKHTGIRMQHDARWKVMVDRPESLVLRMVDQGDLIGQCNVSRLPKVFDGEQLSLERFKSDVRQALGESFGQVLDSTRLTTEDGRVVLRVLVNGTASGLAVNWVYYHISDAARRRASLVFTFEAGLASRFAEADLALIKALRLEDLPERPAGNTQTDENAEQADARSSTFPRRE